MFHIKCSSSFFFNIFRILHAMFKSKKTRISIYFSFLCILAFVIFLISKERWNKECPIARIQSTTERLEELICSFIYTNKRHSIRVKIYESTSIPTLKNSYNCFIFQSCSNVLWKWQIFLCELLTRKNWTFPFILSSTIYYYFLILYYSLTKYSLWQKITIFFPLSFSFSFSYSSCEKIIIFCHLN